LEKLAFTPGNQALQLMLPFITLPSHVTLAALNEALVSMSLWSWLQFWENTAFSENQAFPLYEELGTPEIIPPLYSCNSFELFPSKKAESFVVLAMLCTLVAGWVE